ncbi:hypothetical protein COO60DRAFT_1646874 [Scenedesmus sp. NREL 46B-D3]|nr:hypothetical protein COO60DRAFT_1646874 [Scenedesmus sp. NREL 46B-D3]
MNNDDELALFQLQIRQSLNEHDGAEGLHRNMAHDCVRRGKANLATDSGCLARAEPEAGAELLRRAQHMLRQGHPKDSFKGYPQTLGTCWFNAVLHVLLASDATCVRVLRALVEACEKWATLSRARRRIFAALLYLLEVQYLPRVRNLAVTPQHLLNLLHAYRPEHFKLINPDRGGTPFDVVDYGTNLCRVLGLPYCKYIQIKRSAVATLSSGLQIFANGEHDDEALLAHITYTMEALGGDAGVMFSWIDAPGAQWDADACQAIDCMADTDFAGIVLSDSKLKHAVAYTMCDGQGTLFDSNFTRYTTTAVPGTVRLPIGYTHDGYTFTSPPQFQPGSVTWRVFDPNDVDKHVFVHAKRDDVASIKQRIAAKVPCTVRGRDKLGWDTKKGPYIPSPLAAVHCMWGQRPIGHAELCDKDAVQAHLQMLSYLVHGDEVYACNAIAIVRAWCSTCKAITGDNRILVAAWSSVCFARCMEMLKYTYRPGFAASGIEAMYNAWVDRVVMPALTAPITWTINGHETASNWHAARAEALMQLAVFRDDAELFDLQVAEFRRMLPIIIKPSGLGNEVARDLMHAQFSLGSLAQICELAHKARPGLDLYKELDNRLAKGMEFVAALILEGAKVMAGNVPLKLVAWHPAGAWGLSVTAYERRGVPVPSSRKLLDANTAKEYPWLAWGSTNLTHRIL